MLTDLLIETLRVILMSLLVHYIIHNEVQSFLICILNGNVVVAVNQVHRQPGLSLDIVLIQKWASQK